jgi:hypothetical protein
LQQFLRPSRRELIGRLPRQQRKQLIEDVIARIAPSSFLFQPAPVGDRWGMVLVALHIPGQKSARVDENH